LVLLFFSKKKEEFAVKKGTVQAAGVSRAVNTVVIR
jgi:hypothetical protein